MLAASSACGASTKNNTLHINMNHSTEYATGGNGGTDCETGSSDNNQEGISACHLSLTKGDPLLSVLGGRERIGVSSSYYYVVLMIRSIITSSHICSLKL